MDLVIENHLIDAPIDKILTAIKKELVNGKSSAFERKGDNYSVTCPHHKGGMESHPSCQIYCGDSPDVEYGHMYCFTCGEQGPLYHFVGLCFDQDDEFGKEWLLDRFGSILSDRELNLTEIELPKSRTKDLVDGTVLEGMQKWHPYLQKRRLSRDVCERFGVRYDPKSECIVFPVWDEDGDLVMMTRRSVNSKMFLIDADKEKPIYLYNEAIKANKAPTMVVESQINALTAWGWGIPTVALFGTGTSHQYELLNKGPLRSYLLCLDGDDAGRKGIRRFLKNIRKDVFVDVVVMPDGKDVNDMTYDEFSSLEVIDADEWIRRFGK